MKRKSSLKDKIIIQTRLDLEKLKKVLTKK